MLKANMNLISLAECSTIIRNLTNCDECKVADYSLSKYSDGYPGFLGEYFALTIRFHDATLCEHVKSFFLKSLPIANKSNREIMLKYGMFKKESDLYKQLFPKLRKYSADSKWCADCYYTRDDLIVFEDLQKIDYKTLPTKDIDPTINHLKIALHALASFHASNIIYERLELRPRGLTIGEAYKDMLFETSYDPQNPWCMTGIRTLKAVALHKTKYGYGSIYEEAIENNFMERACKIFDLIESMATSNIPKVCCHRDIWKNNLMIKFDSDDMHKPLHCLLVDFQISRYLPLSCDAIICMMLPSRDHSNVDNCKRFYYDQLANELMKHNVNIESIMLWEDFAASCENYKLLPLMMQPMFWSLAHLPIDYIVNLLATNEAEYMKICNENRDDVALKFIEHDDYYRETMIESVERLIEYLFVDEKL